MAGGIVAGRSGLVKQSDSFSLSVGWHGRRTAVRAFEDRPRAFLNDLAFVVRAPPLIGLGSRDRSDVGC